MKKNRIAVCDAEEAYACSFAAYLNEKRKLPFRVEVFTDMEKFCQYAGKSPPEILLVSEKQAEEAKRCENLQNIIILSEEKENQSREHKVIYKYQSADTVIREVMEYYAEAFAGEDKRRSARKLSILGVYSPAGETERTLLAFGAGRLLAEKKKTLYLSLNACAGFEELFGRTYEKNLSDLFYEIQCIGINAQWKLESMAERSGGLDYIPPVQSAEDIRTIEFSQWLQLFEWIRRDSGYEIVVLDIGECVDGLFSVMDLCDQVYVPRAKDWLGQCRIKEFEKLRKRWKGKEEDEKIRFFPDLPVSRRRQTGDFWEELLWGPWGEAVKRALREDGWIE